MKTFSSNYKKII